VRLTVTKYVAVACPVLPLFLCSFQPLLQTRPVQYVPSSPLVGFLVCSFGQMANNGGEYPGGAQQTSISDPRTAPNPDTQYPVPWSFTTTISFA
jgi:hypothetical protein